MDGKWRLPIFHLSRTKQIFKWLDDTETVSLVGIDFDPFHCRHRLRRRFFVLFNDKSVLASHRNGPINPTNQCGNNNITAFQHKSNERALPMFWSPSLALCWNAEKCSDGIDQPRVNTERNTCAMCCCCCCSCLLAFRVSCLLFHLLVLHMEISFFQTPLHFVAVYARIATQWDKFYMWLGLMEWFEVETPTNFKGKSSGATTMLSNFNFLMHRVQF